jgi:uncharacterized protein
MGGWGAYVYHRSRVEPGFLGRIGVSGEGLGPAFRDASLVAAGALAAMAAVGAARGTLTFEAEALPLLALYPVWGLTQQVLVQGFVAGNLADAGVSGWVVVPVTAAAFGAVHLPNAELTAGTAAIGLAFTPVFLAHRNVWLIGLYHGVLGVGFYYWVLGQSPGEAIAPRARP